MRIGTKSLLFGAHAFWWHPIFVALAWYKLYGWHRVTYRTQFGPTVITNLRDWRLWAAFIVHDWGYWGSPDMDGKHGERHPLRGGMIMDYLTNWHHGWYKFMIAHSRALAHKYRLPPSPLAAADKLSLALEPWQFYLLRTRLTGEIREYQSTPRHGEGYIGVEIGDRAWEQDKQWWLNVRAHLKQWAETQVIYGLREQ